MLLQLKPSFTDVKSVLRRKLHSTNQCCEGIRNEPYTTSLFYIYNVHLRPCNPEQLSLQRFLCFMRHCKAATGQNFFALIAPVDPLAYHRTEERMCSLEDPAGRTLTVTSGGDAVAVASERLSPSWLPSVNDMLSGEFLLWPTGSCWFCCSTSRIANC
jgi:hypothetical protein